MLHKTSPPSQKILDLIRGVADWVGAAIYEAVTRSELTLGQGYIGTAGTLELPALYRASF
jgi:hypothetical protein